MFEKFPPINLQPLHNVKHSDSKFSKSTWDLKLGARVNSIRSQGTFVASSPEKRFLYSDLLYILPRPILVRCVCIYIFKRTYFTDTNTLIHIHTHTYIHTYTDGHTSIHSDIHTYILYITYIHTYIYIHTHIDVIHTYIHLKGATDRVGVFLGPAL